MPRTKGYLENEAKELGITLYAFDSVEDIMDKIRNVKNAGRVLVEQFEPMGAKDAKIFFDYNLPKPWNSSETQRRIWWNSSLVAEIKYNGIRAKMHLYKTGNRIDSRNRSETNYAFNELTANFPQFSNFKIDELLDGTILDGEFMMPLNSIDTGAVVTKGSLTTTMAVTGSGPDKAVPLQQKYGWCEYYVFDLPRLCGKWIADYSWLERRVLLEKVYRKLNNPHMKLSKVYTDKFYVYNLLRKKGITCDLVDSLVGLFEGEVAIGGEGLMFKDMYAIYEFKHCDAMWKMKKFSTYDGFITGYIPGEGGFTGLIGSLKVSAYLPNGEIFEFAAVSQMTLELRHQLTAPDGSLKQEYYGKVVEVKGQERTKTNRMQHGILFGWRPDRNAESCHYELERNGDIS